MTKASDIAQQAAEAVGGDRERTHGDKSVNFETTAMLWNTYIDAKKYAKAKTQSGDNFASDLDQTDVAMLNILQKMSRVISGAYNPDDFVDIVGYGACAGEVAAKRYNETFAYQFAADKHAEQDEFEDEPKPIDPAEQIKSSVSQSPRP